MDIAARQRRIEMEIERHQFTMGPYHWPRFAAACRKEMANYLAMPDAGMVAAITSYSRDWMKGVRDEQERLHGIQRLAATLSPGHEKMVHEAMFVSPCTAGELAERIITADRQLTHRMPSAAQ